MLSDITFQEHFHRLQEKVLAKRPVLRQILAKHGGKSLLEYANEYVDVNLSPPIMQLQSELLSTIHEATRERFGEQTANDLVVQMEKYYFVSTADHLGPITHPFFVNSNLLTAVAMHTHSEPTLKFVPVLACANVSLNNSSFPRGLLFNSYKDNPEQAIHMHRLSFLPSNAHSHSAYNFRAYTKDEVVKVEKRIQELLKEGNVTPQIAQKVAGIVNDIYNKPDILACTNFRDQIGRTNRDLWKRFFASSGTHLPDLIYLDQEDIVVRLLTKYHLNCDTVINHIIFDPTYEQYIDKYFEGIFGSFSKKDKVGTYLFWALPKGAKLNMQLWKEGNYLVSNDGSYRIELHPEKIRDAMLAGELIPSLLLNFMTICLYYGLKCLGGFSQVNYLTEMKNAYIKMNTDLANYRSIEVCARAQTREICCGLTLAFLGYDGGRVAMASGMDLILYEDADSWKKLMDLSKKMTIEEALNPLMPEMYRVSYDEKEWEPELLISEQEINQQTGLDKKVAPCVTIKN